jgi:hypothetical protein
VSVNAKRNYRVRLGAVLSFWPRPYPLGAAGGPTRGSTVAWAYRADDSGGDVGFRLTGSQVDLAALADFTLGPSC